MANINNITDYENYIKDFYNSREFLNMKKIKNRKPTPYNQLTESQIAEIKKRMKEENIRISKLKKFKPNKIIKPNKPKISLDKLLKLNKKKFYKKEVLLTESQIKEIIKNERKREFLNKQEEKRIKKVLNEEYLNIRYNLAKK